MSDQELYDGAMGGGAVLARSPDAIATGQRFAHEVGFHFLEAHVLDSRCGRSGIESKIGGANHLACRHENPPFDRVIEFAVTLLIAKVGQMNKKHASIHTIAFVTEEPQYKGALKQLARELNVPLVASNRLK